MDQRKEIINVYQREDIAKTFDEKRFEYKFQKYKHLLESRLLYETLKLLAKRKIKVLDVACGTGRMIETLGKSPLEIDYTGLDTSKAMTKILLEKAKKFGIGAKVKIGDATQMPFEDNSFDLSYTYHLTWHLPKELQEKIIREMIRVTKKDGYIIFDVLNENFLWEKIKWLFGKRQTQGIYKMSIREIRKILDGKNYELEKLSDFPVKNSFIYSILNFTNNIRGVLPSFFFHMLYFRVKK